MRNEVEQIGAAALYDRSVRCVNDQLVDQSAPLGSVRSADAVGAMSARDRELTATALMHVVDSIKHQSAVLPLTCTLIRSPTLLQSTKRSSVQLSPVSFICFSPLPHPSLVLACPAARTLQWTRTRALRVHSTSSR